jgi:Bacterial Ig-like domain (group 2)
MPGSHSHRSTFAGGSALQTPASISISPSSLSLPSGTSQLTATIKNTLGGVLNQVPDSWASDATGVATVSQTGLVTFVSANGTAHITATKAGITSNACTVSTAAVTGTNLFKMDFQTMTSTGNPITGSPNGQSATNNTGGTGVVVTDPLGIHDQVWRVHYINNPPGQIDDNKAILPLGFSIGLGQDIWFQGDVALDATARMDASGPGTVQRKLLYWGPQDLEVGLPHGFSLVLSSFGPQFWSGIYPGDFPGEHFAGGSTGQWAFTAGVWHTFKVHLRTNSTLGSTDGLVDIWYDGFQIFHIPNAAWTDAATWADSSPSQFAFTEWNVGDQVDNGGSTQVVDEYRYWDNISFATTEAAL